MLKEKSLDLSKYEIYASDISKGVLLSAEKGVYSSYSIRNVPEAYLKKYFTGNGDCSILDSSIKKSIIFRRINLIDSKNINLVRGVDVIFCRNMLIYFNAKSKQKVISHLYDCLNPGGYLFIGASESLHNVTRAFRPSVINKVIIYKKV
jgi:chemotaxis protein methyltransferase CheR